LILSAHNYDNYDDNDNYQSYYNNDDNYDDKYDDIYNYQYYCIERSPVPPDLRQCCSSRRHYCLQPLLNRPNAELFLVYVDDTIVYSPRFFSV